MITTIIIFILTLLLLVVSHELGHFLAAKKFGVKVLEFGFGLPPKLFGKKIGDTPVSINLLPIGGFVRLFGEDETDKEALKKENSFAFKPVFQRMVIVVAGVVMNLILAILLFWIVLFSQGFQEKIPLLTPYQFFGANQQNETVILVGQAAENSPAKLAGINPGDQIVKFNNISLKDSQDLINLTKENLGNEVFLSLKDPKGAVREVRITPRQNPPAGQGALGIELGTITVANLSYPTFLQKATAGITYSYNLTVYSMQILGNLIGTSIQTKNLEPVSGSVAGPVGITNLAGTILQTESPLIPYLSFMALLSLNLAIFNILPIPALDGARLLFLLIEAVVGRRVKPEVEKLIHTAGFAVLISLIIIITFSDIRKLFS